LEQTYFSSLGVQLQQIQTFKPRP